MLQEEISTGTVHTQLNIVHTMNTISKNIPQGSMGLVHIKSTRNTVPVPRHWCCKYGIGTVYGSGFTSKFGPESNVPMLTRKCQEPQFITPFDSSALNLLRVVETK